MLDIQNRTLTMPECVWLSKAHTNCAWTFPILTTEVARALARRILINQINHNHAARTPDNLARNVSLIRELKANIMKVKPFVVLCNPQPGVEEPCVVGCGCDLRHFLNVALCDCFLKCFPAYNVPWHRVIVAV